MCVIRTGTSSVSGGEEVGSEVWGTFLGARPPAWLGAAEEECLSSRRGALTRGRRASAPAWWEELLDELEPGAEDDFLFPIISRLPLPVRGSSSRPKTWYVRSKHFPAQTAQVSQEIFHPAE